MTDYKETSYDDASFDQKAARSGSILLNPAKKVSAMDGFWMVSFLSEVIRELDSELEAIQKDLNIGLYQSEAEIKKAAMRWRHRALLQQALNLLIKSKEA